MHNTCPVCGKETWKKVCPTCGADATLLCTASCSICRNHEHCDDYKGALTAKRELAAKS